MIPPEWLPHRRASDDELVGYLVPAGDAVVPVTLFGFPLSESLELDAARDLLEVCGLSILAEPWRLEMPDGELIRVLIREVSPDRLVVVNDDFGAGGNLGDAILLEVPEAGRLSPRR